MSLKPVSNLPPPPPERPEADAAVLELARALARGMARRDHEADMKQGATDGCIPP